MDGKSHPLMLCAGVFIGAGIVLGVQSLEGFESVSKLLADESASAVVRNYGLLAAGLVTFAVAALRYGISVQQLAHEKHTRAQQHALEKHGNLNERYQQSAAMLGHESISIRQAGLFSLADIAKEAPKDFYIKVQSLYCGFLREASGRQKLLCPDWEEQFKTHIARRPDLPPIRADMEDAIQQFSRLRKKIVNAEEIEISENFKPVMTDLFMPGYNLVDLDLSRCILDGSILSDTIITHTSFRGSG